MSQLAELILDRFVERRDVYALQRGDGSYLPCRRPLTLDAIESHLAGEVTLGHYVVSPAGSARVMTFDIDLTTEGHWYALNEDGPEEAQACNPREVWRTPGHPGIPYLTFQLRSAASAIGLRVGQLAEIPVAVAASGSKGLHVYGFTGTQPAGDLRSVAEAVLTSFAGGTAGPPFEQQGVSFRSMNCPNYRVEVFPKQGALREGGLGNLVRLPLGVNRKSGGAGFFVDQAAPLPVLRACDPITLLENGDSW